MAAPTATREAPTFAPGTPVTWTRWRPYSTPLLIPAIVLGSPAYKRVKIAAPLVGGGTREVFVWGDELRERGA